MKLKLRLLVERHRDGRRTANVLGLPPETGSTPLALVVVGEARPVSQIAAYGDEQADLERVLSREVSRRIEDLDPAVVARWRFDPDERLERIQVPVVPVDWDSSTLPPVTLELAIVVTTWPDPPHRVFVPRLGLVVSVTDPRKAAEAARVEAGAYLKRNPAIRGLDRLHALHPAEEETLEVLEVEVRVRTPIEVAEARVRSVEAARARARREDAKILESVATDLLDEARNGRLARSFENESLVDEVRAFLRSDSERALLLVGPSGAGKTAALHEAIHRVLAEPSPPGVFHATGSRLVAGMSGFGDWQERCRAIVESLRAKKAVLSVGDPLELVESGQAIGFDVSIAQYLKRPIEEGHLRVIGECTEEARDALERRDRGFASLFRQVKVEEPDRERTLGILARVAAPRPGSSRAEIAPEALARCHDLHARFAPYEAFPGKAIRFLDRISRDIGREGVFGRAELTRAFARATGLPEVVLADDVALDPDSVRAFFRERVVGQDRATGLVADLIARVKAGVADPRRPLGSFLFLGPTGVGKTETAKALAQFLFGSRERIVRLDMTEYQDALAAARLTGGALGEAGDLTRPVRAEPLSVVLLDEVEKAHPSVYDLLLQVLGDARLTDARGRPTDFRSTILILTSNLGTELPEGSIGFEESRDAAGARFLRAAESFFRPELVNRLDAIVPFEPLSRDSIRKIATREIDRALERDGLVRRGVEAEVAPALVERVLEAGFHPRHGARPLKRAIERLVVRPLAFHLCERAAPSRRLLVDIGPGGEPEVRSLVPGAAPPRDAVAPRDQADRRTPDELLERLSDLRRKARVHQASDLAREVKDKAESLRKFLRRKKPNEFMAEARKHRLLARLDAALGSLETARRSAEELEDLVIAIILERDKDSAHAVASDVDDVARALDAAVFKLRATRFDEPDSLLLLLAPLAREKTLVPELASSYVRFAWSHGYEVQAWAEGRKVKAPHKPPVPVFAPVEPKLLEPGLGDEEPVLRWTGALVLLIEGENACARFFGEDGRHRHVPAKENAAERHALVRALAVTSARERRKDEVERSLERLHTVKFPDEDAPRGIPAAIPEIARVYKDRGKKPSIKDPRTGLAREPATLAEASGYQDEFARAYLELLETELAKTEGAPA